MRIAKVLLHSAIGLSMIVYMMSPFALLSVPSADAAAGISTKVGYQGRLKNSSGTALSGTYDFIFKLFNASSGGTALATETHNDVVVTDGYFTAQIQLTGDVADFAETLFLSVQVKADAASTYETMSTRVEFNSVAYSFYTGGIRNASSEPTADLANGVMYYNTTNDNLYVYDGSAFQQLATNLDDAYDGFGSAAQVITVDDAVTGISFDVAAAGNYDIDLQSTGDFRIQDNGTTYATFSDAGAFTLTDSSSNTLIGTTAAGVVTIGGTSAGTAVSIDVDGTSGADVLIDAYDATSNLTGQFTAQASDIT